MTTTFTKSEIFKMAWEMARALAEAAGTGPRAQFGTALKQIYSSIKEVAAEAAQAAARRTARLNEIEDELDGLRASLLRFGPRASSEKTRLQARRNALREEAQSLLA